MPPLRVLPEVTAKLCRMGEKIAEVPIAYTPRSAGEGKKIRHADGWLAIGPCCGTAPAAARFGQDQAAPLPLHSP